MHEGGTFTCLGEYCHVYLVFRAVCTKGRFFQSLSIHMPIKITAAQFHVELFYPSCIYIYC